MRRTRGLGDVLHYFISDDEQAEARGRQAEDRVESDETPASGSQCWVLPTAPDRPLSCTVALELAVAASRSGFPARVFAPFAKEHLLQQSADVDWHRIPTDSEDAGVSPEAAETLAALGSPVRAGLDLLVLYPQQLGSVLRELGPDRLSGVLLPIDAVPGGPAQALGWLRQLPPVAYRLRIGAVVIGARERAEAQELFTRVRRAVSRQLGLRVEDLGELLRDPVSFKALLRGVPVMELDPDAQSARSLVELCQRLVDRAPEPDLATGS